MNGASNHLRIVNDLLKIDPLFMKNSQHLTLEEHELSDTYKKFI